MQGEGCGQLLGLTITVITETPEIERTGFRQVLATGMIFPSPSIL